MINIEADFNIGLDEIQLRNLSQKPYQAFIQYWQGEEQEFYEYMEKHKLNYDFKSENLTELLEQSDKFLNGLSDAIKKDISKWDFRLSTALTGRNLKPLEDKDFVKITLKNDEVNDKPIYDTFLSFNSRSFVDFRSYNEAENTLTFIYNRRGIFDESDRIAVVLAKQSVTLQDNFRVAKDNNFIVSGLCYELASNNGVDFKYEYTVNNDIVREVTATAEQITSKAEAREEAKAEAIQERIIKEEAREEVVRENAEKRQSLDFDSNRSEILKEGNTEIRLNIAKDIKLDDINDIADDSINKYILKEQEKLKIRLEKAQKEATVVYKDMQERIFSDGMSIYEAMNYAKQKYREEHTVNMASAFLTKDIVEVGLLKTEISNKDKTIEGLNLEVENKNTEITKREETISSLKSTVQSKNIEITNLETRHEQEKDMLVEEAKKKYSELDESYKQEIMHYRTELENKDEELSNQDDLITRLSSQLELLKGQLEEVNQKYSDEIRKNAELETKFNNLENLVSKDEIKNIQEKDKDGNSAMESIRDFFSKNKTNVTKNH